MDERRDGRHEEVDAVADQQDRQHDENPHNDVGALRHEALGQRIEDQRQHTARQSDGEQADVGEHVAQQAGNVVIKVPHTGAEVEQRIAPGRIEEQHQHGADPQHDIERHGRGAEPGDDPCRIEHRESAGNGCGQQHDEPPHRTQRIAHAEGAGRDADADEHAEQNLHHADGQGDGEEPVLEVEEAEQRFAVGFQRHPLLHVHPEERTAEQPEKDRCGGAHRGEPCGLTHHAGLAVLAEQPQTHGQQDQTVARIVETDAEEQHIERGEERREVDRAVAGPGVHVAHQLEDAGEPPVLELDRRIVLGRGVALDIDHVGILLQQRVDLGGTLRLGPSLHDDQHAVGGLPGRGLDLEALQPLLERSDVGNQQRTRGGGTCEVAIERLQFGLLGGNGRFGLADVHLRRLHLLCIEVYLLPGSCNDDEPHHRIGATDLGNRILLRPFGRRLVVGVALGGEITQHDPLVGELLHPGNIEIAPRTQFVGALFEPRDLGLGRGGLALGTQIMLERLPTGRIGHDLGGPSGNTRRNVPFLPGFLALLRPCLEEFERLVAGLDIEEQLTVFLGRLPTGDGNIDQSQLAQLFYEIAALRREEHKVVFRHSCYHNVAPSPACCCLVFTIFCADLERFSSSSMKRLILRIASS